MKQGTPPTASRGSHCIAPSTYRFKVKALTVWPPILKPDIETLILSAFFAGAAGDWTARAAADSSLVIRLTLGVADFLVAIVNCPFLVLSFKFQVSSFKFQIVKMSI